MSRTMRFRLISPTVLGTTLLFGASAIATETTSIPQANQLSTATISATNTSVEAVRSNPIEHTPAVAPLQVDLERMGDKDEQFSRLDITEVALPESQDEPVASNPIEESAPLTDDASVLEQINRYNSEDNALDQVTNVSQLRDVSPGDWAFEALRELVERYGCIVGYPDGTFRGNRATTRFEFAAGLNACLNQIERLIAASTADFVTRDDLETLQRLVQEFEVELATLGTRVDNLDGRVAFLEDNQFSTTTKLAGEVIFGVASIFTGESADGGEIQETTVLGNRTRLNLETSFTGQDLLRTRLATGNFPEFAGVTGTREGEFAFAQPEDNDLGLEVLLYSFPISDRTQVVVAAQGGAFDDFASTVNFLDGDGASGALSAFGTRNPIYYLGDGAGIGIRSEISDALEISLGYLAGEANNPSPRTGLFDGPYSALAQLVIKPSERLNIGLTYINSYNADDTGTGSSRSSFSIFDDAFFQSLSLPTQDVPTSSNSYGVELSWQLSDRFVVGGWAGYTTTRLLSTLGGLVNRGDTSTFNYAVTLAFPDLGKEGNLAGIVLGVEPKLTDTDITVPASTIAQLAAQGVTPPNISANDDTSFHIEAFYQYRLTDNILITPGVIWITAPGFNNQNDDIVIGAIRTTFSF
jgi:hypothetical protein